MSSWRGTNNTNFLPSPGSSSGGGGGGGGGNNNNNNGNNSAGQYENNGPRAKCDQVIFEAIAKAAEIVVGSRCWIDGGGGNSNGLVGGGGLNSNSNNNSPSSNSSSRFNLLVSEIQGVRSILQRWKRALHVPLRLDVYYQHKDSQRELLERWCLEYAPRVGGSGGGGLTTTSSSRGRHFGSSYDDPIVQLRQVCKQIVVWLRTLYCWSRMLPAQALRQRHNNPIGFSIYVVSEGNDDVTPLVENQGFLSQGQPHSVTTPYGELGWRVFYAPKNPMIQRLLPTKSPYDNTSVVAMRGSPGATSRPIPMQQHQHQGHHHQSPASSTTNNNRHTLLHRESSSPKVITTTTTMTTAHSAPTSNARMYQRSNSATPDMISDGINHNNNNNNNNNGHHHLRTNSGYPSFAVQQQPQQHHHQQQGEVYNVPLSTSADNKPPTKSMSGLSLAMMQSDETIDDNNNNNNMTTPSKDFTTPSKEAATTATAESAASAEKRRAALHHAPPQFGSHHQQQQQQQFSLASSPQLMKKSLSTGPGEYGYGYNNHIPMPTSSNNNSRKNSAANSEEAAAAANAAGGGLFSHPSQQHQPLSTPRSSTPTTPLGSTPPGYLYGGPTPPAVVSNFLIPPRSAVTPPFVRPMGFVGEAPNMPQPGDGSVAGAAGGGTGTIDPAAAMIPDLKAGSATIASGSHHQHQQHHHQPKPHPPATSLDLLHSSPFQHVGSQHRHPGSELFRGIDPASSVFPPPASYNPQSLNTELPHFDHHLSIQQQLFADHHTGTSSSHAFDHNHHHHHSITSSHVGGGFGGESDDDDNCMPFAVDDPIEDNPNSTSTTFGGIGGSSLTTATATRKKKLAMFESADHHQSVSFSSLADQLAEFKSFGASLNFGTATTTPSSSTAGIGAGVGVPGGDVVGAVPTPSNSTTTTNTPIYLKT